MHRFFPRMTRRGVLRLGAAAVSAPLSAWAKPQGAASPEAHVPPDLALELRAVPRAVALHAGAPTPVWVYRARVLRGDPAAVQTWDGGWLGPILHLRRGQHVRIDFINGLGQPSIVNWHGLHVPADMMGLPRYEVAPGARYRYEFQVDNRAGTYWYHAMSAGHTPEQVYFGLAGLLYVHDAEESALPLPRGDYDLPLVLQDRDFGADSQLRYLPGTGPDAGSAGTSDTPAAGTGGMGMMPGMMDGMAGHGGMMGGGMRAMMTRMMGFFGTTMCVNGRPRKRLEVATHAYRLRILNASNARTYKLAWEDGRPLTVIATDGGLLDAPVRRGYVMLTPGQRVELWADFSADAVGSTHRLISRAFAGSMGMMGEEIGAMMGAMVAPGARVDGAEWPLLEMAVTRRVHEALALPDRLAHVDLLSERDAGNAARPRTFDVTMARMRWGFNGRSLQMGVVAADEVVRLGSTEVWEFVNNRVMAHAIHIHGLQFQVLGWGGAAAPGVGPGRIRVGWQDTVLLMPGERVRLLLRFADFTGLYAYQCHMLEHAATGLMRDYRVRA